MSSGPVALSVALATHDGARWLPELLESLADQSRRPDELVVCDDVSGDDTRVVLDSFAGRAPFPVRRIDTERCGGPVRAFDRALGACGGDLVALCDQDDRWGPEKLAVLEEAVGGHDTTLAFCDATMIDASGGPTGSRLWAELGFRRRQQDALVSSPPGPILRHAVASGCTMLFRRELLDAARPFPAALDLVASPMLHDRWLSQLAGCSGRVVPVPVALMEYRVHDRQAVGARWVGYRGQVRAQAARGSADVRARAEARLRQLDALEGRLDRLAAAPSVGVHRQLADLRHHLEVRADLSPRRTGRVRPVLGEVLVGGYRRFGSGPGSAALDLVRR